MNDELQLSFSIILTRNRCLLQSLGSLSDYYAQLGKTNVIYLIFAKKTIFC